MSARPYVICHMVTSLDGKIHPSRWATLRGQKHSTDLFETTAATFKVGAWIVGSVTMHEITHKKKRKLPKAKHRIAREDFVANPKARTLAIGTDAKRQLRFDKNDVGGDHVVLLITDRAENDYLSHLRSIGVSYLFCGKSQVDLRIALRKLREVFTLKKLMLEGGGTFNGAMLQAGLVDEVSHIVVPVIDGGKGITGFFEAPGDAPKHALAALRQTHHKKLAGGVNWFRYRVIGKAKS